MRAFPSGYLLVRPLPAPASLARTRLACLLVNIASTAVFEPAANFAKASRCNIFALVFPRFSFLGATGFGFSKQPQSSAATRIRNMKHATMFIRLFAIRNVQSHIRYCVYSAPDPLQDHVLGDSHSGSSRGRQGLMPLGLSFRLCFACSMIFVLSSSVANCLYSRTSL